MRAKCRLRAIWQVVVIILITSPLPLIANAQVFCVERDQGGLDRLVAEAAARFGLPTRLIESVMAVESQRRICAISPKGAIGLMQVMPATYADLRLRYRLGNDPFDPRNNLLAGAAYLRELCDQFGFPGALAAYNAGPKRWQNHLATGQFLPVETQRYLARLQPAISDVGVSTATPVASSIFIGPSANVPPAAPTTDRAVETAPLDHRLFSHPSGSSSVGSRLFVPRSNPVPSL